MRLKDRVIVVTNVTDGIGAQYCARFVQEGANVVIADSDLQNSETIARSMNENSQRLRALAIQANVTSETDTERIALAAMENFDRIDILVNNAGSYLPVNLEDLTYKQWQQAMAANLDSAFLCVKAVLPYMKQQPAAKIINVSTDLVWIGLAQLTHYVTARAGIIGFTRSLARELGKFNITVNALAPGTILPPLERISSQTRERFHAIIAAQALKRPLAVEDLLGPMVFLASSDSDFMTGQILSVDGGLTMH